MISNQNLQFKKTISNRDFKSFDFKAYPTLIVLFSVRLQGFSRTICRPITAICLFFTLTVIPAFPLPFLNFKNIYDLSFTLSYSWSFAAK